MTSGKFVTTIGYEKRFNPALGIADEAAFVRYMTSAQPTRPANYLNIVAINQGKRELTLSEPRAAPLATAAVERARAGGAVVIDARTQKAFGRGHLPGSLNVQLASSEFEQRVGWVAPAEAPLVLVVEARRDLEHALSDLAVVGLDRRVAGYLEGGIEAWTEPGRELATLPQVGVNELASRLAGGDGPRVLDVREPGEWGRGHVAGALRESFKTLPATWRELPLERDEEIAIICASGQRSSTAASILRRHGFGNVSNVRGGMSAWRRAGLPLAVESDR